MLYVQTEAAMVHAIDAETGRTLWSKRMGGPTAQPAPGRQRRLVAVVNGSRLYVFNRFNGDVL